MHFAKDGVSTDERCYRFSLPHSGHLSGEPPPQIMPARQAQAAFAATVEAMANVRQLQKGQDGKRSHHSGKGDE